MSCVRISDKYYGTNFNLKNIMFGEAQEENNVINHLPCKSDSLFITLLYKINPYFFRFLSIKTFNFCISAFTYIACTLHRSSKGILKYLMYISHNSNLVMLMCHVFNIISIFIYANHYTLFCFFRFPICITVYLFMIPIL